DWLLSTPNTGTTPQDITVSVDITGLADGTFKDTLVITSTGADNSPQYVVINLTVTPAPSNLVVSETELNFTAVEGGDNPTNQLFNIASDNDPLGFDITEFTGSDWISSTPNTGTTPQDITVSVDITGLTDGSFKDTLVITSTGADNSPQYVVINLTVTPYDRELVVTPDTLYFTAEEENTETEAQYLVISEFSGDNIAYTIDVASIPIWLAITNTSSTTPDSSRVAVSASGLTAGVYLDSVLVSSAGAGNSPYAYFEFTVTPRPTVLVIAPDTLKFSALEGGANPDPLGFEVTEEGGASIGYSVFESTDWFSIDSPVGTTPDSTIVMVNISGLSAGTYYGSVTFSDAPPTKANYVRTVMLSVVPPENDPPVLDPIGPQTVAEGGDLIFVITSSDPNGTTPSLSALNLPEGATFEDSLNGHGLFVWWPTYEQEGTYYVTFKAYDGDLSDSEIVQIDVTNTNRLPYFIADPNDTTIDECMTLELTFIGTDPDGDDFVVGAVYPLPDNMIDSIYADTILTLHFYPDTTQAGIYEVMVYATENGIDTVYSTVTITVEDCFPCGHMVLSDTSFYFEDTIGVSSPTGGISVDVTSPDGAFCFTVDNAVDSTLPDWFSFNVVEPCTPGQFNVNYDMTGYPEGYYDVLLEVVGSPNVCLPNHQFVSITVQVIDTTTPEVPSDSILVGTMPAVPGSQVVVPVNFTNSCNLWGIYALINWESDYLFLDSVSWDGSAVEYFVPRFDTIYQFGKRVYLNAMDDTALVAPGYWHFANLYFSVAPETPPGSFLPIQVEPWSEIFNSGFSMLCGSDTDYVWPTEIGGGILVDSSQNYVCGYVVDTAGIPIPGATVELYGDFPIGPAEDMTTTNGSGAFSFSDFYTTPFDLWAYHPGYYPGLVENINYGDIGIMIVLTPIDEVTPTPEWVNFYCDNNTYFDQPLPVGSVVDAYDPDGVHCGSYYVTDAGSYGFMPVYRDDEFSPEDEGAEPGNNIRFFVNGMEVQAYGETIWTENGDSYQVCLEAGDVTVYCDLHEGWNLVSWRVDHESDYILDALTSIDGCLELVLGFEQGALTYDPNLPVFSTLWQVDHLSGYWIKVSCDITLEISGAPVSASTPIEVYHGWNLVSYLPDFGMGIEAGFSSLDGNLLVATGEAGIYIPDDINSSLTNLEPCKGYWVKVGANDDLIYPAAGPAIAPQNPRGLDNSFAAKVATDITPTTNWINLYSQKLTLDGEVVKSGAVVSAYTKSGVKAGTLTMIENGLFGFMPVYADDISSEVVEGVKTGESFYLTVDGVETKETFTFEDGNGARVEISNLTAGDHSDVLPTEYSLSQNYPNPFNPTTTIEFSLPTAGQAKIEVYNILGELVTTPFDGFAGAGENSIVWDGTNSSGQNVSSGIYFYRLTADEYTETRKMTLLK
ncbi:MAG: T9SS type A sorting domain-containing protein, partial [bacterium]